MHVKFERCTVIFSRWYFNNIWILYSKPALLKWLEFLQLFEIAVCFKIFRILVLRDLGNLVIPVILFHKRSWEERVCVYVLNPIINKGMIFMQEVFYFKKCDWMTSLVVWWLRVCLALQEIPIWSLAWELRSQKEQLSLQEEITTTEIPYASIKTQCSKINK